MTRVSSALAAVAVGLLLGLSGGCASSPPMRFYTLTEVAAQTRLNLPADTVRMRIDRVTIPSELDRLQLVRRLDGTRLQISEVDRWAAPLDEMIRRVLSGDLAARLAVNLVADTNEPSLGERRQSLSVDILEFYTDAACATTLRATWVLKRQDAQSSQATEEVHVPAGGGCPGAAQPDEMSRAVALLSDRIAVALVQTAATPQTATGR